jgi:hypothetical protein
VPRAPIPLFYRASAVAGALPQLATGAPFSSEPRYAVRPHAIFYTGDSTGILGVLPRGAPAVGKQPGFLNWKTWNRARAYAVGTVWLKNCLPDCASSQFRRYSVAVTATLPRHGRFSTMTLRYRIRGHLVTDVRCDSGHGYFDLPPDWPRSNDCLAPSP